MAVKSVASALRKWKAGMATAGETARESVQAMTEAPSAAAIAMKDTMRANWLASLDSGRWEAAMRANTLENFRAAMINKGIPNMVSAASRQDVVARTEAAMQAAHSEWAALQAASRREKREGVSGAQRLANNLERMKALRGRFRQR